MARIEIEHEDRCDKIKDIDSTIKDMDAMIAKLTDTFELKEPDWKQIKGQIESKRTEFMKEKEVNKKEEERKKQEDIKRAEDELRE